MAALLRIRYRRALPVTALICALAFVAFPLKDRLAFSIFMLNAVPMLAIALAFSFRSVGELTDRELTVRALYGGAEAYFLIEYLRIVDGRLYYRDDRRVPIAKWVVDAADWRAITERVQAGRG